MTDLDTRLVDEGTELERRLLRAGREEHAPERTLEKTLLAIAATSAVVGTGALGVAAAGSGAAASQGGATASLTVMALKWLGIGAVGGLVTMSGVSYVMSRGEPPPKPAIEARAPVARAPVVAPREVEPPKVVVPAPSASSVPEKPRATAAPATSAPPEPPSIAAELADIDAARAALAAGQHATALGRLDAWEQRPGRKAFAQEALFLRMDALAQSGRRAEAEQAARRLLQSSPDGPHAAKARALIGASVQKK